MSMLSNLDLIRRVPLFSMLTTDQARVVADGVVKRRFYKGPAGTQARTEVVAMEVCEVTKRRQAQRVLEHAVTALRPT
jgi:hypothetical protein